MKKLLATIALSTSVDVRDRLKAATLRMRTCGLTALIGLCVAHLPAKAAEFISRDELRADITQTYELLRSHHPNLSAHTGRKDFDDLYKRLLDDVGESNSQDEAFLQSQSSSHPFVMNTRGSSQAKRIASCCLMDGPGTSFH